MICPRCVVGVVLLVLACASKQGFGETIVFDFDAGLPPGFSVPNSTGLFNVDDSGQNIRISKPVDDGSINPDGFISAGIRSDFSFDGDYTVTVDFQLVDFPPADGTASSTGDQLNESVLSVIADTANVAVLRFRRDALERIEAFYNPPGIPVGDQASTLSSGKYRLVRSGTTLTSQFAPEGSASFTTLGSQTDPSYGGPTKVGLSGVQGLNPLATGRSITSLDIIFDNLVIEAEVVPEPTAVGLLGVCCLGVVALRKRLHRATLLRSS